MSDEKVETGGAQTKRSSQVASERSVDADRDTNTNAPEVEGGQPAVGDDLPRNTEF